MAYYRCGGWSVVIKNTNCGIPLPRLLVTGTSIAWLRFASFFEGCLSCTFIANNRYPWMYRRITKSVMATRVILA